jgi:hypothetical protein
MPETELIVLLRELQPIEDRAAAETASADTHANLFAAIIAESYGADQPTVRHSVRRSGHRPLVLAGALAALVAVLLIAAPGLLSDGDPATQPQSAQAAILRRIAATLAHRPGTVVVQVERLHLIPGGFTRQNLTFTYRSVIETSSGGQEERGLTSTSEQRAGFQMAGHGKLIEIYDPGRATIYITTLRAWQALTLGHLPDRKRASTATTSDPTPVPGRASIPEQELRQHLYRIGGNTRIDGRRVLKLVPVQAARGELLPTIYVSPRSYYPVREITPAPPHARVRIAEVTNWLSYEVLPADRQSQSLVSLTAQHPHSKIVRGAQAYIEAQQRANQTG